MTKLLPAFLVAFLLSAAPALAQTCPATPTACPSPTYNNLTAGGLLSANGGLVATTGAFTTLSTTGNLTVGGIFSTASMTLTGAGTALSVTNNATIGGTLGVGSTLTLGTGGTSNQRIQASGTGNMVVQLGGSASIMNFVAGTGNSLLQINSATNQVTSERMLVLNALGVSNPVASGSAQTAPLYSTLAWTGSSTLNNTVLSTGFYISNSTAIAAANNVPQNVGYIANVTATGVNGNVGGLGVNLVQNAVNAMSGSPTYTALASYMTMKANDGGTGTGTNARGQGTALNLVAAWDKPGAFFNGGSGTEIDVYATTGTYIQGKVGILVALTPQGAVQGDIEDAAMVFDRGGPSVPGWKTIFQIGDGAWAGIDPTNGWVMRFFGHNFTGSVPGAGGIDFTNFTPSVAFIQGPGFLLDPSGNWTANSLKATAAGTALTVTNNATIGGTLGVTGMLTASAMTTSLTTAGDIKLGSAVAAGNNVMISTVNGANIELNPTGSGVVWVPAKWLSVDNTVIINQLSPTTNCGICLNLDANAPYAPTGAIYPMLRELAHLTGTMQNPGGYALNNIAYIDNADTSGVPNGVFGMQIAVSLGAGFSGADTPFVATLATGANLNLGPCCLAIADFWGFASHNAGGTGPIGTAAKGSMFAMNPQVVPNAGASYWVLANGQETDLAVAATSQHATIAGTFTAGDTISLTFTSPSITGSPVTVTATVGAGNVANNVCNMLDAAVNSATPLVNAGVSAICQPGSAVVSLFWPLWYTMTVSKAVTGAATETVTLDSVTAGASASNKSGITIVRLASDSSPAANVNGGTAIGIGSQTAPPGGGFDTAFSVAANAVRPTGTILSEKPAIARGNCNLCGYIPPLSHTAGIDLSYDDFARNSGASLKMPGFTVSGTGALTMGASVISQTATGLSVSASGAVGTAVTISNGGGGGGSGNVQSNYFVGDVVYDQFGGQYTVSAVNPATGAITTLHVDVAPSVVGSAPGAGPYALTYGSGSGANATITWGTASTIALQPSGGGLSMNGTAAVSCAGTPTASFASTNGIVTHC